MAQFSRNFLNKVLNTGAGELNREVERREAEEITRQQRAQKLADIASGQEFQTGLQEDRLTAQQTTAMGNRRAQNELAKDRISAQASEGVLDRESRERIAALARRGSAADSPQAKSQRARLERAFKLHQGVMDAMTPRYSDVGDPLPINYDHANLFATQYNKMRSELEAEGLGGELPELDMKRFIAPPEAPAVTPVEEPGYLEQAKSFVSGLFPSEAQPQAQTAGPQVPQAPQEPRGKRGGASGSFAEPNAINYTEIYNNMSDTELISAAQEGDEEAKKRVIGRGLIDEPQQQQAAATTEEFVNQIYKNMSDEDLKGRVVGGDTAAAQELLQRSGAEQQQAKPVDGTIKTANDGNKYVYNQGQWVGPI